MGPVTPTDCRQKISDHHCILTLPYGPMLVNSHDPLIEGSLQENLREIAFLSQFARGGVCDIGANVGSHAINFAKTADVVYAFEPQPLTYYNLCANLLINCVHNVVPFNMALGNYNGQTTVYNLDETQPNTPMGIQVGLGTQPVPIHTLDSLGLHQLTLVKIDVEGYELEVLRGSQETLKREQPIVFVEVHKDFLETPIIRFMEELGYQHSHHQTVGTHNTEVDTTTYHLYPQGSDLTVLTTSHLFWMEGRITWL